MPPFDYRTACESVALSIQDNDSDLDLVLTSDYLHPDLDAFKRSHEEHIFGLHAAFGTFMSGVTSLSTTLMDTLDVAMLWERTSPILEGMPEVDANKADSGRLGGKLAVEHVAFRYHKAGPVVLDDVSLYAAPEECIALVGPSGGQIDHLPVTVRA